MPLTRFALVRILSGLFVAYFMVLFFVERDVILAASPYLNGFGETYLILIAAIGFAAALAFATGAFTRVAAVPLILSYQLAIHAFPPARQLHVAYFSMMFLVYALFFEGPRFSFRGGKLARGWRLPLLLAVYLGFTVSGLSKLFFPPWPHGTVIQMSCPVSPLARLFGGHVCALIPMKLAAWLVLAFEILAFPLALFPRTRRLAWWLTTALHFGILALVNLPQISIGVLIFQLFLYE